VGGVCAEAIPAGQIPKAATQTPAAAILIAVERIASNPFLTQANSLHRNAVFNRQAAASRLMFVLTRLSLDDDNASLLHRNRVRIAEAA
jgi:hypothetical protein